MAEDHDDREVIRNFTAARKFPQLIGRTPDGKQIRGGPYTVTQVVGVGVVVALLWLTHRWWMSFGVAGASLFAAVPVVAVAVGLGRLRPGGRNPLSMMAGVGRAVTASSTVKIDGRVVHSARRAHATAAGGRVAPDRTDSTATMSIPRMVRDPDSGTEHTPITVMERI